MKDEGESVPLCLFEIEEAGDLPVVLVKRHRNERMIKAALDRHNEHDWLCGWRIEFAAKRCSAVLIGF